MRIVTKKEFYEYIFSRKDNIISVVRDGPSPYTSDFIAPNKAVVGVKEGYRTPASGNIQSRYWLKETEDV